MEAHLEKTEYNYLLGFYLSLSAFDPMTSTFTFLTEVERKELNLTISVLQRKLHEIMPKVQDREATFNNATNKTNDAETATEVGKRESTSIRT